MRTIFFKLGTTSVLLLAIVVSSCYQEEEPIPRLESELPLFNKINVAQNITVNLRNGEQKVEITGDGNLDDVVAQVNNGELNIYNRDPSQESNVIANIWLDHLDQLVCRENSLTKFPEAFTSSNNTLTILARNTASIKMEQLVTIDSLYVGLRDASHMAVAELQSRAVAGDLRDATHCNMEGQASHLSLLLTDGSKFNLDFEDAPFPLNEPLQTEHCSITAQNGSSAWIYATNLLEAVVSDGSIVYYKGTPATIEQNLSSGGQLLSKEN